MLLLAHKNWCLASPKPSPQERESALWKDIESFTFFYTIKEACKIF